jgi:cysteinyl-tRNA synthetase
MYVCGPTVYDFPHIGNARSVVIYDVLYRILINQYGQDKVCYVRNITDVDDKINQAAKQKKITIKELTSYITDIFHSDMSKLNCLSPTIEPKATEHINQMVVIIEKLIASNHAYMVDNHVYFSVESDPHYGLLASRNLDDMIAGARVEVNASKRHPADFVLWKPKDDEDDESSIFPSPWGPGRPGWHIECTAMSNEYLGHTFDIHGGGADLMFPHHTNEIAQSICAFKDSQFAKIWVHNGFLTVNGEKMSKSLGNFITVHQLLADGIEGETLRYLLLATHYRKPLDFNNKSLIDAKKSLDGFYRSIEEFASTKPSIADKRIVDALLDDLNTSEAIAILHELGKELNKTKDQELAAKFKASANLIGLLYHNAVEWFGTASSNDAEIETLIAARNQAKLDKNWELADQIRQQLKDKNIILEDKAGGTTIWRKS